MAMYQTQRQEDKVNHIAAILRREASKKRWANVSRTTKQKRANSILSIKVLKEDGRHDKYMTEDEVFDHASAAINHRYRKAYSAPTYSGKLFDNIVYICNTTHQPKISKALTSFLMTATKRLVYF